MFYLLNTKEISGYTYTPKDIRGVKTLSDYGLEENYYGGRAKKIGLTDAGLLLVLDDSMNILDIGTTDLENLTQEGLRSLLRARKIPHHHKLAKPKLIALLEGREIDEGD